MILYVYLIIIMYVLSGIFDGRYFVYVHVEQVCLCKNMQ